MSEETNEAKRTDAVRIAKRINSEQYWMQFLFAKKTCKKRASVQEQAARHTNTQGRDRYNRSRGRDCEIYRTVLRRIMQ
jgi:hypothetical protein